MPDWGASGRVDSYEYRLVDPFTLRETGETVNTVEGESELSFNYYGDNIATGTIVTDKDDIDGKLVRVYHTVTAGGEEVTEVLGTFFADSSTATAKHHAVKRTHACYSTLYRHTEDSFVFDFARPAGTNIVGEMRDIVEADGGHLRTLPGLDTGKCHTVDIWFEIGSNKGEALRTIAGWCGWELGVDPYGFVTVGNYVPPTQKAPKHTLWDDSGCLYLSGYDFSNTDADAINRCLAYFSRKSKQDDESKDNYDPWPLTDSTFADLPDRNPFSYRRIGRHRTYVLKVGDACSHDDLDSQAQRYLYEHSGAYYSFQIEHVGIPGLRQGDTVRYVNTRDGSIDIDLVLQVAQIRMKLGPGCKCSTTLREVY